MKRTTDDRLLDLAGALQEFHQRLGLGESDARLLLERVQMLRAQLVMGARLKQVKPLLVEMRGILQAGSGDLARGATEEIDSLLS
jgi:hypothetical protein